MSEKHSDETLLPPSIATFPFARGPNFSFVRCISLFSCYRLSSLISFILSIVSKDAGILGNFKRNFFVNLSTMKRSTNVRIRRNLNFHVDPEYYILLFNNEIIERRSYNILYRRFRSTTSVFPKREFLERLPDCGFL